MTKRISLLRQYLNSSRTIHYSLILVLPALAIYEIGILILFRDSFFEMRNSGEILLRSFFTSIKLTNPYIVSVILLSLFALVMIRGYKLERKPGVHANYLVFMLLESMWWGVILFTLMHLFLQIPFQMVTLEEKFANINLAIGAGIFEEMIFRMVIITALIVVLNRGLNISHSVSNILAILVAACIFAAFHLFMESYSLPVFAQRVSGGVFLGILYNFRGYGISVYTHIIFNFLILANTW
ncbi:MAG: CPBP family intramembrane metalloprotease [Candidatus Marinimicrobia bacterium]|nr:CPBP family intramembrane metalloprotease [Candidatus Neomarinimicrobiota bacterium]